MDKDTRPNRPPSPSDTKLFYINDNEEHWVSARSPERAMELMVGVYGELEEWKDSPPVIREWTREDAQGHRFTFEDGERCSLWNAYTLVAGFEVFLCSTLV